MEDLKVESVTKDVENEQQVLNKNDKKEISEIEIIEDNAEKSEEIPLNSDDKNVIVEVEGSQSNLVAEKVQIEESSVEKTVGNPNSDENPVKETSQPEKIDFSEDITLNSDSECNLFEVSDSNDDIQLVENSEDALEVISLRSSEGEVSNKDLTKKKPETVPKQFKAPIKWKKRYKMKFYDLIIANYSTECATLVVEELIKKDEEKNKRPKVQPTPSKKLIERKIGKKKYKKYFRRLIAAGETRENAMKKREEKKKLDKDLKGINMKNWGSRRKKLFFDFIDKGFDCQTALLKLKKCSKGYLRGPSNENWDDDCIPTPSIQPVSVNLPLSVSINLPAFPTPSYAVPTQQIQPTHVVQCERKRNPLLKREIVIENTKKPEFYGVTFYAKGFPTEILNQNEMTEIEESIVFLVGKQDLESKLNFVDLIYGAGWLRIICGNADTVDWIKRYLYAIGPLSGKGVFIEVKSDETKSYRIVGQFPKSSGYSNDRILRLIDALNEEELDARCWKVLNRHDSENYAFLSMDIGEHAFSMLNKIDGEIFYRFAKIKLDISNAIFQKTLEAGSSK